MTLKNIRQRFINIVLSVYTYLLPLSKTRIKLKFHSVQELWRFAQHINAVNIEINTRERTLICDCNEAEITLAVDEFGAAVAE